MARRELGPASLEVAQAVAALLPEGDVVVGCSGGADSMALAMGAQWAARRSGTRLRCLVVDHGLQPGSADVADSVAARLRDRGLQTEIVTGRVTDGDGPEAAARDLRYRLLEAPGHPVLLGHTLDDQAESVLLALLRGSGTRAVAGMSAVAGLRVRPLLGVRRATTVAACAEWGIEPWADPHNDDPRFARVLARRHLAQLNEAFGRDVAPALARSASLARADADLLDSLARDAVPGLDLSAVELPVAAVSGLPEAIRRRVLRDWLAANSVAEASMTHLLAVDALAVAWRGQGPVDVPGGRVWRDGRLLTLGLTPDPPR